MTIRKEILEGMSTILWGSAWADHAEDHKCCNLSGCEITEHMPEIPAIVREHAEKIATSIEAKNGATLEEIFARATAANLIAPENILRAEFISCGKRAGLDSAQRFGECLAFMSRGDGVSWFDDNAEFPLGVPYGEDSDLRYHADKSCTVKNTGRVECPECGHYKPECDECEECCSRANATYTEPTEAPADDDTRDYGYDSEGN